jgi:CelD/BcsL family acetyltransferase involved in cellulose biosynthesis
VTRIETIDPVRDERWLRFISRAPQGSIFHHPRWLGLVRTTYGYSCEACCVVGRDGLLAGLPTMRVSSRLTGRRLVAVPFSDLCEPLVHPAAEDTRAGLLAALSRRRRDAGLDLEIRAPVADLQGGRLVSRFFHHTLRLPAHASAAERLVKPSVRRGVAKARREGLVTELRTERGALRAFYALHLRTRRRQGVPIQPKRFIEAFAELHDAGLGFTLLVRRQETVVAAAVFLTFNGVLTYKYGASDERHLQARPNNLLFMEAIGWACEHGMHTLDLGRTSLDNSGLAAFKRGWGADERVLPYTYTSARPPSTEESRASRALAVALRHGPEGLTRAAGELLYKHVG